MGSAPSPGPLASSGTKQGYGRGGSLAVGPALRRAYTRAQTYARSAECAGEGDDTVRQHTMTRRRCLCPVKIIMANAQRRASTTLQELRLDRKDAPLVAENLRTWHRTQPGRNTALAGMVTARSHYTPSMARFPTLCQITPSAFQQIPLSDDTAACAVARPCSISV